MTITWPPVEGAVAYDVEWRKDSGNWIKVQRTGSTNVDVVGIYAGAYVARVRAVSAFDISSIWRNSVLTNLKGKEGLPPAVSFLTATSLLFGIGLKWGFPAGAEDTQRTEIWYGPSNALESATKLADLAYPQSDYNLQSLLAGATFFFWARLVDRTGNIGPWYPVGNGVLGQASSNAGPILELIKGQITETELGQDLLDEINKIPGLQDQIDNLEGLGGYVPTKVYLKGQMVVGADRIYQAKQNVPTGNPPPNTTYWLDVGQSVETANGLAQQVATNTADITEIDGVVTSQATAFEALRASYRDDNGEGELADAIKGWTSTAAIAQETSVRANENEATARRLTTFDAQIGENAANVTLLEQVVVTNQQATAQQLSQISTTVGEQQTAIQQNTSIINDVDGKVTANWSVKMQYNSGTGQYITAGVGLGIENGPAGLQSQFLVSADRFAIVNTIAGGAVSVPFAVQGGQVFMNSAFIQDGSITMLKIGQYLQSDNYVVGVQGWRLDKAGNLEFNGPAPGGGRLTMTNRAIKVYDENGVKRVQLGDLSA
jgi:predicted phage tail protein